MNDYEDAVMAETAARAGADVIVTRNLRDYRNAKIKAMPPSDFLAILDRKE
jgi:predicted nucleic acid-binding protein